MASMVLAPTSPASSPPPPRGCPWRSSAVGVLHREVDKGGAHRGASKPDLPSMPGTHPARQTIVHSDPITSRGPGDDPTDIPPHCRTGQAYDLRDLGAPPQFNSSQRWCSQHQLTDLRPRHGKPIPEHLTGGTSPSLRRRASTRSSTRSSSKSGSGTTAWGFGAGGSVGRRRGRGAWSGTVEAFEDFSGGIQFGGVTPFDQRPAPPFGALRGRRPDASGCRVRP
jgi:hypothetical protein